ncbi:Ulp1 protease family, carboxy-terminal domain protein [Medicago truncatula]|uniref:Ulp1 protease family, carboxy-terminal domain protein n=1 Tax=Medicago truncatula TaxID=3880 RepID=A0A072TIH4_MEDTR|nr:Ulp1 protease family, carboxy-terminal domain protein [Medicago truncatula]
MSQAQKLKEVTNKGRHSNIPITKQKQDIAKTKHRKPNSTKCRPSWVSAFKSLVEVQMENSDTRQVTMEEGIFGEEQYNEEITKEQMYEFVENTEIGVSVVCVYIRYLYEKLVRDTDFPRKFSFLSPHRISLVLIEAEQELVKEYMVKEFLKYKDEVLKVFRSARDAQVSNNKFNNISWVRVQCPRQENGIDCGYFVMRFMKEILISKLNEIPKLIYAGGGE